MGGKVNSWELTKQIEANWIKDRPIVSEDNNLEKVGELLQIEAVELIEAIAVYAVVQDEYTKKEVLQEASDVGLFLMAVFRLLEADMLEEFREKTVVNSLRYPASECQDGVWVQVYPKLKASQQPIKDEFYA